MYWDAIHFAICLVDCEIDPENINVDFEKSLINATTQQFPNARIVGCLFYFKQAIRRYAISKLDIHKEQVHKLMEKNVIDLLTIIPKKEIKSKGIPFVKSVISKLQLDVHDKIKWDKFWTYFENFWCSSEKFITMWNIHDKNEKSGYYDIHNRTNNGIERYDSLYVNYFNFFSFFYQGTIKL